MERYQAVHILGGANDGAVLARAYWARRGALDARLQSSGEVQAYYEARLQELEAAYRLLAGGAPAPPTPPVAETQDVDRTPAPVVHHVVFAIVWIVAIVFMWVACVAAATSQQDRGLAVLVFMGPIGMGTIGATEWVLLSLWEGLHGRPRWAMTWAVGWAAAGAAASVLVASGLAHRSTFEDAYKLFGGGDIVDVPAATAAGLGAMLLYVVHQWRLLEARGVRAVSWAAVQLVSIVLITAGTFTVVPPILGTNAYGVVIIVPLVAAVSGVALAVALRHRGAPASLKGRLGDLWLRRRRACLGAMGSLVAVLSLAIGSCESRTIGLQVRSAAVRSLINAAIAKDAKGLETARIAVMNERAQAAPELLLLIREAVPASRVSTAWRVKGEAASALGSVGDGMPQQATDALVEVVLVGRHWKHPSASAAADQAEEGLMALGQAAAEPLCARATAGCVACGGWENVCRLFHRVSPSGGQPCGACPG